jgi:hypothetical protein
MCSRCRNRLVCLSCRDRPGFFRKECLPCPLVNKQGRSEARSRGSRGAQASGRPPDRWEIKFPPAHREIQARTFRVQTSIFHCFFRTKARYDPTAGRSSASGWTARASCPARTNPSIYCGRKTAAAGPGDLQQRGRIQMARGILNDADKQTPLGSNAHSRPASSFIKEGRVIAESFFDLPSCDSVATKTPRTTDHL